MNCFMNLVAGGKGRNALGSLALVVLLTGQSLAHFLYLVPARERGKIQVAFSENLLPDDRMPAGKMASLKLTARAQGQDQVLESFKCKQGLSAQIPEGTNLVFGSMVYGLMSRGESSSLLVYHPKLMIGSGHDAVVGEKAMLEIVPHQHASRIRFQLLYQGNPVAEAEGSLLLPNGTKQSLKTDHEGFTEAFTGQGRYGLWMRHIVAKPGEHSGKKYAQEKHYATLVGEFAASIPDYSPMPTPVSGAGAVAADGFLYVYGGHLGIKEDQTTQNVIGEFFRLNLTEGKVWESLPAGPIAEGACLVSHRGQIIRLGGMQPRNDPGQPEDHVSLTSCARFDPKTNLWNELPPLPAGRSSHEAVVVGDKIVVLGGWRLKGADREPVWHDTALILDLAQPASGWRTISQPFKRRALTVAVMGQQIFVMCGLGECGHVHQGVDILDLETGKWSAGPSVPGEQAGYGPAAATVNGQLLVSTFDGPGYRLEQGGSGWQKVGHVNRPRMVHRLVPHANGVLLVGGATPEGNVAEVEYFVPSRLAGLPVILGNQHK